MKKILAIGLSLVMMLALAACGNQDAPVSSSVAASSAAEESTEAPGGVGGVQIGNPYVTCADAAEMYEQAGLELTLPAELPAWVNETIYRAMPGTLAEVIYAGEDNVIRVRAAAGSEDISGVYDSDHGYEADLEACEYAVHVKGEETDGAVTLYACTWTFEGRTYSVTSTGGVAEAEMLQLVSAIR